MRVIAFGFRGFPGVEGGIESHAENIYPLLAKKGCDVDVLVRRKYWKKKKLFAWRGVRLVPLWAPEFQARNFEALVHSFICAIYTVIQRPDIVHIHGTAVYAAIFARLFGMRVVTTNHGPDYFSTKWGFIAKLLLRFGEFFGMKVSHKRIAVSNYIKSLIKQKYGCDSVFIPNGVVIPGCVNTTGVLDRLGLIPFRYFLYVSRFAEHKNHGDLIDGFVRSKIQDWKLVFVGSVDLKRGYDRNVILKAEKHANIVFAGFQDGTSLAELFAQAACFVMPSSYEGLPIALLEALSHGLFVLASNIPAHMEIDLAEDQYFELGNTNQLAEKLSLVRSGTLRQTNRDRQRLYVKTCYDWERIAEETLAVYVDAINEK